MKVDMENLRKESILDKSRIKLLEDELAEIKNKKNSNNSSIPPSKDENRNRGNQSLREKSGKKSGGQPGHKGHTLSMVSVPDMFIKDIPELCHSCGKGLSDIDAVLLGKRQVVEIPPIKALFVQYETYQKQCSCGKVCSGSFPDHVKAPIQYGSSVANLVAYLSVRHFIPYKRTCELFEDLFHIPLSEGTIANLLGNVAKKLEPDYLQIHHNLENASTVLGGDETGAVVNGSKGWFWVWQDTLNTYISAAESRGKKEQENIFPNGFPSAVLSSDAYAVHLSTPCKAHQLCLAHLTRDLNFHIQVNPFHQWPRKLKSLFKKAIALKHKMTPEKYLNCPERDKIELKIDELLKNPPQNKGKMFAFYNRIIKNRDSIFPFLYHEHVVPDNNASERGIRNIKVKQKVSGQFKSIDTAQEFAIIRSLIDTWIKRGFDILDSFDVLPNLAAE